MALSIVPALLSLLAPPAAPAGDLLVHVVDKDGKPVAGAQVAIGSRMESHGPFPAPEMYTDLKKTEPDTGCARFSDLSRFVKPMERMHYFVRLGAPAVEPIEAALNAEKLEEEVTLTLPECGQVLLRTPCSGKGTAQLRLAPPEEGQPPFWRRQMPPSVDLVGGGARFEHVGLGVELEYRVFSPELPSELRGRFRGPVRKGQVVEITVEGPEASKSTLLATLVDGNLKPIADVQIDWSIGISRTTSSGSSSYSNGGRARSDEKGRVRMPLTGEQAQAGARHLSINAWSDDASAKRLKDAYAALDLPPEFASGELDLGELIVVPYGDPARFLRTDDGSLRRAFEAPREGASFLTGRNGGSSRSEMLCEMVRRGGAAWEKCVAEQLAAMRAEQEPHGWHDVSEAELLTALRRLQGKPDPLALVIQPESVLEATFPETPTLVFAMKNVDSESFGVTEGGSYRSGRFGRCNVLAIAPDGTVLPPREWDSGMGGGMSSTRTLAPGEIMNGALPLGDYVALAQPGSYRVRLRYHDVYDIDSVADLRGRIFWSSEEFRVQIRARRVELGEARREELRGALRALDTTGRIPLVSGHWHEGLEFKGECKEPADVLFRAGWQALPVLLEALEDPAVDRARRAWALGMLWNIAGVQNPILCLGGGGLGRFEWIGKWPTSVEDAQRSFGEFSNPSDAPIYDAAHDELVRRWLAWKPLIEVKIVP